MGAHFKSFRRGVAAGAAGMLILFVVSLPAMKRWINKPGKVAEVTSAPAVVPANPVRSFDWRMVESADYQSYIANLRAIGCPEETIRDIIIADVNNLFEDRGKSLFGVKTNRLDYWKPWGHRTAQVFDEGRIKAQQQLAREKRAVLKELLGVELEEQSYFINPIPLEEEFDFLNPKKRAALIEVEQQYAARRLKISMDADVNEIRKLEKEHDAEIATLLSPEEMEDYRLRLSETASRMTRELAAFDPTEQEFREIFKLRKQIETEYGMTPGGKLNGAATEELNALVKTLLGDSRYADYEHSQDDAYQVIYRLAEHDSLGKDAANKIYDLKKAAEAQAAAVRADTSLTREQRDLAMSGIRNEADRAARAVFGKEAMLTLEGQGNWLGHIAARSVFDSQ